MLIAGKLIFQSTLPVVSRWQGLGRGGRGSEGQANDCLSRAFGRWLENAPRHAGGEEAAEPVRYEREGDVVTLTLTSPATRNAMTAAMRDALYEGLVNVLEDPSEPRLVLRAEGKCFSTGGYLPEFGTAHDLAAADVIRTQRSCARVLHRLGSRATVRLHGACIGSGIEVPAAASRRIAAPDLIVQLPELTMGLILGAGGTASLVHAIGRHRLLWLTLGAFRIGAEQARDWGLVHAIEPRFLGDALADPLAGLEAALAVLAGQRGLIDMAMARVAAAYVDSLG